MRGADRIFLRGRGKIDACSQGVAPARRDAIGASAGRAKQQQEDDAEPERGRRDDDRPSAVSGCWPIPHLKSFLQSPMPERESTLVRSGNARTPPSRGGLAAGGRPEANPRSLLPPAHPSGTSSCAERSARSQRAIPITALPRRLYHGTEARNPKTPDCLMKTGDS